MRVAFLFALLLACLGLPMTDWFGAAVLALGVVAVLSGSIRKAPKSWAFALIVAWVAISARMIFPDTSIHEGHNVYTGGEYAAAYQEVLPPAVSERLEKHWQENALEKTPWKPFELSQGVKRVFAQEPESLWKPSHLSRSLRSLSFENPRGLQIGEMNSKLYNTYGAQWPSRTQLPMYFRFDIPSHVAKSASLCWRGEVFLPTKEGQFQASVHEEKTCQSLDALPQSQGTQGYVSLWAISVDPDNELAMTLEKPLGQLSLDIIFEACGIVAGLLVLVLLVERIELLRGAMALGCVLITFVGVFFASSQVIVDPSGFILLEGGNDGLVHFGYARKIFFAAMAGDWFTALKGVEPVFDFQAGYRYFHALSFTLFGNTFFGGLLLVAALPFVLFRLITRVLGRAWAEWLMVVLIAVPALEAFGFFHMYYLKEFARGFAEPVAYMCFFAAMALSLGVFKGRDADCLNVSALTLGFVGFLFAVSVAMRANLAPGTAVYLLCLGLLLVKRLEIGKAASLSLGFLPMGLVPLHNWYYGTPETFFLLTRSATRKFNMGASPEDYWTAFQGMLAGQFSTPALETVKTQIFAELKPSEPWFYLVLLLATIMVFRPATDPRLRVMGVTALALQSLTLFYRVGGRYGYVAWTLTVLVALACLADVVLPRVLSEDRRAAIKTWVLRRKPYVSMKRNRNTRENLG